MNELIDSDPELYAADSEEPYAGRTKKRATQRERFRMEM